MFGQCAAADCESVHTCLIRRAKAITCALHKSPFLLAWVSIGRPNAGGGDLPRRREPSEIAVAAVL